MRLFGLIALFLSVLFFAGHDAVAQATDLPPMPESAMQDDEPIRLTPDGPAVIRLNEDATSVIIGNPNHATALLENPRLLMLMPSQPGATKVMALNREGKAILNRHVLVGTGKAGFKRISRVCTTSTSGTCVPVSMYYCPGKCYETAVTQAGVATGATGDIGNPVTDSPENPSADSAEQGISEGMSVVQ